MVVRKCVDLGGECRSLVCRSLVVMLIFEAMHYLIVFQDCVYCNDDTLPGRTYKPMSAFI